MIEKKADNTFLSKKDKINKIDEMLDIEKKKIKKIESLYDDFRVLNSNMDKCIDLLSKSINGPNVGVTLNNIRYSNKELFNKSNEKIDNELKIIKKKVNSLYKEKESIIKSKEAKEE